jgi:hypothetical protein
MTFRCHPARQPVNKTAAVPGTTAVEGGLTLWKGRARPVAPAARMAAMVREKPTPAPQRQAR